MKVELVSHDGVGCSCLECRRRGKEITKTARERAERLLRKHLTPEQKEDWRKNQAFNARGSEGSLYRVSPRLHPDFGLGVLRADGEGVGIWPRGLWIPADFALAMLLWLQADESLVEEIGCHTPFQRTKGIHDYKGKI